MSPGAKLASIDPVLFTSKCPHDLDQYVFMYDFNAAPESPLWVPRTSVANAFAYVSSRVKAPVGASVSSFFPSRAYFDITDLMKISSLSPPAK